jgi:catechol 2,3-dioxygenase-like lactoylglutathione lyase family enzyme
MAISFVTPVDTRTTIEVTCEDGVKAIGRFWRALRERWHAKNSTDRDWTGSLPLATMGTGQTRSQSAEWPLQPIHTHDMKPGGQAMATIQGDTWVAPAGSGAARRPAWRGVNHLALITPDMDATVRFYHGVLGMRLVATLMAGPMRHYFFEIAPGNTVAFFEWKGAGRYAKPAGWRVDATLQFDHLSFNVPDHGSLMALRDHLEEADVEVTE